MYLHEVKNLQFNSQLSLKHVEDRIILTADFPKKFLAENQLEQPFLYVTLYARGGAIIKIIDEGTAQLYIPSRKEISFEAYNKIIQFAKKHASQFKLKPINSK